MTIINPTPMIRPVQSPREAGTDQADLLYRLSLTASEVERRFARARNDSAATSYVLDGKDFDAQEHADAAAWLVARVLGCFAAEIIGSELADSCLDGTESKQFRKGYKAALDQVGTELLEIIRIAA